MDTNNSVIFHRDTVEFVTVAAEFCGVQIPALAVSL